MSNQSSNLISTERFESIVGAPIPSQSQEIPLYLQNAFQKIAGQIAQDMAGTDAQVLVGQIEAGVEEIADHYNLSLPKEPEDIVSFVTQLSQLWVPQQLDNDIAGQGNIDETITRTDPEEVSYPLNLTGNIQPKDSLIISTGGRATVSKTFDWLKIPRTPLNLPPGKSHATRIKISATGRPITTIIIWNRDEIVDSAPSLDQHHKGKIFPIQNTDPGYIFDKPSTHIQVFTSGASELEYRVDVEA